MPNWSVTRFGAIESSDLLSLAFSADEKWVAHEAKDASASHAIATGTAAFSTTPSQVVLNRAEELKQRVGTK